MGSLTLLGAGYQPVVGGGGGSTVTWNPATTVSPIVLSNGNLTASITLPDNNNYTATATGGSVAASQKKYWEILGNTIDNHSVAIGVGFVDGSFVASSGNFLGSDGHSLGYYNVAGDIYTGGSSPGTYGAWFTNGDVIGLAVDTVNSKIWVRVNSGDWNFDVIGNQNPATNTGGVSFSLTAPLYPALVFRAAASNVYQLTARFTSASWTQTAPSGFTQL